MLYSLAKIDKIEYQKRKDEIFKLNHNGMDRDEWDNIQQKYKIRAEDIEYPIQKDQSNKMLKRSEQVTKRKEYKTMKELVLESKDL